MIRDLSEQGSTEVAAADNWRVEQIRKGLPVRRVLIEEQLNNILLMGDPDDPVQFRIHWHSRENLNIEQEKELRSNPDNAPTIEWLQIPRPKERPLSDVPSSAPRVRYLEKKSLGKGAFGEGFKAVEIDTSDLMAVKRIMFKHLRDIQPGSMRDYLNREVEVLTRFSHVSMI